MPDISYRDQKDMEKIRTPGLKAIAILLFILPIPLIIVAIRDFLMLIFHNISGSEFRLILGGSIALIIAVFAWISAVGLIKFKQWAFNITVIDMILTAVITVIFPFLNIEFFTFGNIDYGSYFVWILLIFFFLGLVFILKNKLRFVR